jgi:hypothetical protein
MGDGGIEADCAADPVAVAGETAPGLGARTDVE